MKTYGSAVLTALQAQYKSLNEIERLIQQRRLQAFIKGGDSEEWLDSFWEQMEILETQRCQKKINKNNLLKIYSDTVKIYNYVIVIAL